MPGYRHLLAAAMKQPSFQQHSPEIEEAPRRGLTPARRAALDALEREFSDLLRRAGGPVRTQEVELRIDAGRRLIDIGEAR